MDILSHVMIGTVFALIFKDFSLADRIAMIIFSVLPDILALPHFFRLGINKDRPFYIPFDKDFKNATKKFETFMNITYFFPHSLLFVLLLIPIMIYFDFGLYLIVFYILHILTDIFTHTGEWKTKILYPVSNIRFEGYTDAWRFNWTELIYTWSFLSGLLVIIYFSI